MNMSFNERIGLNCDLEQISCKICENYNLGEFISNSLIQIGYEDFNYILETTNGKYVVKIFNTTRNDKDCLELTNRAVIAYENGVKCPKIYKSIDYLFMFNVGEIKYRLIVMEYINGSDFYSLNVLPNEDELFRIGENIANLHKIMYKPNFVYDKWAIINFEEEYNKNKNLISGDVKQKINNTFLKFKSCDLSKLKYGYVHGDIIETNIIRNDTGELYFIDFSVANYLPCIVDLAVTIGDLCLNTNDSSDSISKIKCLLEGYEKINSLSDYEKECLKVFLEVHQAITIIQTTKEKLVENNNSEENDNFYNKGLKGLDFVLNNNLL